MRVLFALLVTITTLTELVAQSVLSLGNWHKISVSGTGIYKIDRNFISSKLKVDLSNFDPRTFKIYGSPINGALPQENSIPRPNDPVEFPVYGFGTSDSSMDEGDYFLFCGFSPDHFSIDTIIRYQKNFYSDVSCYFLTYGGSHGKRIEKRANPPTGGNLVDTYTEYIIHEKELVNKWRSGRIWLGEQINSLTSSQVLFDFDATGAAGNVKVTLRTVGQCAEGCDFETFVNEQFIGTLPVEKILTGAAFPYQYNAKFADSSFNATISGEEINFRIKFNDGPASSIGFLDYFILGYERALAIYDKETFFHLEPSASVRTIRISNSTTASQVWDISDRENIVAQSFSENQGVIQFNLDVPQSSVFVAFSGSDFPKPEYIGTIPNQNIKSLVNQDAIIISHPDFMSAANRLASFHQSNDGLSVGVVSTMQVYNEFSSGMQDITAIRDFLRYLYKAGGKLKYVLLFGDGSFDYKDKTHNNTNFVPVYESRDSFHPIYSYSSDDYFGFFDENEGGWSEGTIQEDLTTGATKFVEPYKDHTLEIGIGRIPVTSKEAANAVVNKIIRYKTSSKTLGKWRNDIAYFSDNGDSTTHMEHADRLFEIVDTSYLEYNAKKLYLDNFDQENHSSPQATQAILNAIREGVFIFNYIGHGNQERLTLENVFNSTIIQELTNRQKLPLFITATCEFGKYDNPSFVSGAERLLLSPNGGSIGVICTTRPVFAHTNFPVNQAFHENVFKKINGKHPRLGDVIMQTKNNSLRGPVNRNFALLGDPMLRLNYPELEIRFDQMTFENDSLKTMRDTLSALENYTLSGKIFKNGSEASDFNGKGIVTVWDIPQQKVTKGIGNAPYQYEDQTNALYRGEVTVTNGAFSLNFILPKNISYQYKEGKVTMYAWNESELQDASGASEKLVLGGTAPQAATDNTPPTGIIYLNNNSFVQRSTVGTSSLLIAILEDESGINISNNGFNNSITLSLNGQEAIVLNDFYTAVTDNYKEGTVMFPLQNLEPGSYTGALKFWDTHNNSSTITVDFKVSDKPVLQVYNSNLYPNPVSSSIDQEITFTFEHDREGEELEINVSIYTMMGEQIHSFNYLIDNSPRIIDDLKWDVGNFQGSQLKKGIYIYRLNVTSTLDGANNQVIKRLVIH